MSTLDKIATKIIKEQELIIGPVAWREAGKVEGLHIVDQSIGTISFDSGDEKTIIDRLVLRYENLFGRASREICKEAAGSLLADLLPTEVPSSLQ